MSELEHLFDVVTKEGKPMNTTDFTCPACAADFEIRERLDERENEGPPTAERGADAEAPDQTVVCPNCGSRLPGGANARQQRGGARDLGPGSSEQR
jgi:hypothetical protein